MALRVGRSLQRSIRGWLSLHRRPIDPDRLRLWPILVVLPLTFVAAAAALAGLVWAARAWLNYPALPRPRALSVHDWVSVLQLVFASVAGTGALVALIVAYRKQRTAEADSAHDRTRVFNERFISIAKQLGDDKAAVRIAGVHAMAGLADDWMEHRQTCVDVLCAYLRMPNPSDPGEDAAPADKLAHAADQEVRQTAVRVLVSHLKPQAAVSWCGLDLDFTRVRFENADFGGAVFSNAQVSFRGAEFTGTMVNFSLASFISGWVDFSDTVFCLSEEEPRNPQRYDWGGSRVDFGGADFLGGEVQFSCAMFTCGTLSFNSARFRGARVDLDRVMFSSRNVEFIGADFAGGNVFLNDSVFSSEKVSFSHAKFHGWVSLSRAKFADGTAQFTRAEFLTGEVDFRGATFSGAAVDFSDAKAWSCPPKFDFSPSSAPLSVRLPGSPAIGT